MDLMEALTTIPEPEYMKWAYNNLVMDAAALNHNKLVSCYLKKKGIGFENRDYYDSLSHSELEDIVTRDYVIKGEFNLKNLQNAKSVDAGMDEHEIQVKVVKYLRENKIAHFAVPNGFIFNGDKKSSARYLNYMTAEGLKRGVFDLVILTGDGHTAFLELKTEKGRPSEHQLEWQEWFNNNGYTNKIAYGYDEAIEFIKSLKESEVK